MNANEISSKANPRLNRIRTVSRLVKYAMFAPFVFTIIAWIMDEGRKIQEEQELTV